MRMRWVKDKGALAVERKYLYIGACRVGFIETAKPPTWTAETSLPMRELTPNADQYGYHGRFDSEGDAMDALIEQVREWFDAAGAVFP